MELTINNTTLQVSNEGTTIIIKAERGEYREDVWTREPKEEELPEMLYDAMSPVYNGSVAPTFDKWSYLWGLAEDGEDDSEDRAEFEIDRKAWEGWQKVSDINPADVLNKLEEKYLGRKVDYRPEEWHGMMNNLKDGMAHVSTEGRDEA